MTLVDAVRGLGRPHGVEANHRFGSARPGQHPVELLRGKACENRYDGQDNHHIDQGESRHLPPPHGMTWKHPACPRKTPVMAATCEDR